MPLQGFSRGIEGRKISLKELPSWSPWPVRIVGLQQWSVPTRNLDKITAEYNNDKYAKLLYWVETQSTFPWKKRSVRSSA
jgi:hypothetical protein